MTQKPVKPRLLEWVWCLSKYFRGRSIRTIWGSHSGTYEMCHLLGYSVVQSVYEHTFRSNVSPPSSGSKISRARSQRASRWLDWFSSLKMNVIHSFETFFHVWTTWVYIPEDGNFHEYKEFAVKQRFNNREAGSSVYVSCRKATACRRDWHSRLAPSVSATPGGSADVSRCLLTLICFLVFFPFSPFFLSTIISKSRSLITYLISYLLSSLSFLSSLPSADYLTSSASPCFIFLLLFVQLYSSLLVPFSLISLFLSSMINFCTLSVSLFIFLCSVFFIFSYLCNTSLLSVSA
jgi:hypothetical protein